MSSTVNSFNFVANSDAKVLILGSMPGIASLKQNEYYAHPRNHFWPIISALFQVETDINTNSYEKRLQVIKNHQIALWDVLAQCDRKGSLDSDIDSKSIFLNDFKSLFLYAPEIEAIFFNGKTAEKLFYRHVVKKNKGLYKKFFLKDLPSTSPAYAKMQFSEKLSLWKIIKTYIN